MGDFFMPHRNMKDLNELEKSLHQISTGTSQKHAILAGDFNCPHISWESGTISYCGVDNTVQQKLIDITSEALLTQMHTDSTRESITSPTTFNPIKASSPMSSSGQKSKCSFKSSSTSSAPNDSSIFNLPRKQNLRILTINCRSIIDKKSEFESVLDYIKPDIVCGTESWLHGIKPGKKTSGRSHQIE